MGIFSQWSNPNYWLGVLYSLPAILLALSVHEWAHAFAAYKCGDPTARNLGRLTLDPTKHLDLWGTLCLIFFRFGWAKPVPINSRNFKHYKRDNILVSLSGIITNFILSFVAYAIIVLLYKVIGLQNAIVLQILYYVVLINITLGVFNLIPIPPLDGFQVLSTFLSKKAYPVISALNRYGFIIVIILLITGVLSGILYGFTDWLMNVYGSIFGFYLT